MRWERLREGGSLDNPPPSSKHANQRPHPPLLRAQTTLPENPAQRKQNRINPPAACAEARDAALEIRHELQGLAGGSVRET